MAAVLGARGRCLDRDRANTQLTLYYATHTTLLTPLFDSLDPTSNEVLAEWNFRFPRLFWVDFTTILLYSGATWTNRISICRGRIISSLKFLSFCRFCLQFQFSVSNQYSHQLFSVSVFNFYSFGSVNQYLPRKNCSCLTSKE